MNNALISVFNKEGIVEFARNLSELGFGIIATEGTAKKLSIDGISVITASEFTGFQEDNGIKTLHPRIHTGIAKGEIGIVAVNLIPLNRSKNSLENMDLGGFAMIRSAIKNFRHVAVIVNPKRYETIIKELKKGDLSYRTKLNLAVEASEYLLRYESKINNILRFGEKIK